MKEKDELELLTSIENGEWEAVSDGTDYRAIAKNQLKKSQKISLRTSENDLKGLQRRAFEEGIPYQTFITSILHKYLNGRLSEVGTN
jgi:predicted DNA binding CopG/RHH family protein